MNVVLENITKKFGEHVALDNISFEIKEGTLTALLGPSGCGKTTLLRIISGLENSDRGRVLVDSVNVTNTQLQRRKMGFVFQHYALFKHMNIFENVAFGLRVVPKKNRLSREALEARVHEVLSLVQLDNQSKKYPHQLSGGQQQRIALARVLAIHPKILLLDEPFGAIDATVRRHLRRWLRKLHEDIHITTVLVTHDQEEALEVSDTVVLLNHGRLEQVGSPREIYKSPANVFVYEFLGAVNIFQGRMKNHNLVHFTTDNKEVLIEDHEPMYVRAHEVHIYSAAQRKEGDLEGVIIRVSFVGVTVLLEVRVYFMREGTKSAGEAYVIEATTSDSYWEEYKFSQGDMVYVRISNVTVFPSKGLR